MYLSYNRILLSRSSIDTQTYKYVAQDLCTVAILTVKLKRMSNVVIFRGFKVHLFVINEFLFVIKLCTYMCKSTETCDETRNMVWKIFFRAQVW